MLLSISKITQSNGFSQFSRYFWKR